MLVAINTAGALMPLRVLERPRLLLLEVLFEEFDFFELFDEFELPLELREELRDFSRVFFDFFFVSSCFSALGTAFAAV